MDMLLEQPAAESNTPPPGRRVLDVNEVGRTTETCANSLGELACLVLQAIDGFRISVQHFDEDGANTLFVSVLCVLTLWQQLHPDPDASWRSTERSRDRARDRLGYTNRGRLAFWHDDAGVNDGHGQNAGWPQQGLSCAVAY